MRPLHASTLGLLLPTLAVVALIAVACGSTSSVPTTLTATPASPGALAPTPVPEVRQAAPGRDVQRLAERALAHLRWLSQELGPRPSASPQEKEAADYVAQQLRSYGYQVGLQEFPVQTTEGSLKLDSPVEQAVPTTIIAGSGLGQVTASLVFVKLGRAQDFPPDGLEGAIALVQRGEISFREKVENALESGASGVVVFNNVPGLFRGALGGLVQVPVVGISLADGETLVRFLKAGEVMATLAVGRQARPSRNVVATREGSGEGILALGAHYDSVPGSPGANDNASGTAALLALAEELAQRELPLQLRFIAFGSEELGLLGSDRYVSSLPREERDLIVAMLNFDALGAGGLRVGGDAMLVDQALAVARGSGVPVAATREPPGVSSDHASFRAAGIPVLFFSGSDFSRIHTPEDRLEFVDAGLLGQAALLGLELIFSLSR